MTSQPATVPPLPPKGRLVLLRHGETTWSLSGQHTGRTDIPLTPHGEQLAAEAGRLLTGYHFALVLASPLQRARRTAELAGLH
ncbi:MAG TPA: phosphoglycerate mutase family protein, partial [Pedococcus sp.]|nr:phosphoglycerate mutase family protein [Pedococcus sp.]